MEKVNFKVLGISGSGRSLFMATASKRKQLAFVTLLLTKNLQKTHLTSSKLWMKLCFLNNSSWLLLKDFFCTCSSECNDSSKKNKKTLGCSLHHNHRGDRCEIAFWQIPFVLSATWILCYKDNILWKCVPEKLVINLMYYVRNKCKN